MAKFAWIALIVLTAYFAQLGNSATINVSNNCPYTVWVGTNGGRDEDGRKSPDPAQGGFELKSGAMRVFSVERRWRGRIWGRTACKFASNGHGNCETGSCGKKLRCPGIPGEKPATIADFVLDRHPWPGKPVDYYIVSLVDGYNLNMRLKPRSEDGCEESSCSHDMTQDCPQELQMKNRKGKVVGCDSKNGDQSFQDYAERVCPMAYGYWDNSTQHYTCETEQPGQGEFDLNFC